MTMSSTLANFCLGASDCTENRGLLVAQAVLQPTAMCHEALDIYICLLFASAVRSLSSHGRGHEQGTSFCPSSFAQLRVMSCECLACIEYLVRVSGALGVAAAYYGLSNCMP